MEIINTKQGSVEWHWLRLGMITGTRFSQVVSYRENSLEGNLVYERLYGEKQKASYQSPDMEQGNLIEPVAREAYAEETGHKVGQVGFCVRDEWIGCSPDGVVFMMGLIHGVIEIKCPTEKYHEKWLTGKIKGLYYWQCMGNMWVTGAEWADFISYCPGHEMPLYIKRIDRDEDEIDKLRVASGLLIERVQCKLKGQKMKLSDLSSGGDYMKQADVEPDVLLTIKSERDTEFKNDKGGVDQKLILGFEETKMEFVCNITNFRRICRFTETENSKEFVGTKVVLYYDHDVTYGEKIVGGIRVREPRDPNAEPAPF